MCEALETLIEQKILYNQAQIDSLNIDTGDIAIMVENTLSQEIAEKGSQAAVELYYHKPIFDIRSDLQERYEEMRYAGRMRQEIRSKSSVTSGEVERFFKHLPKDSLPIIPEQYVYSQIVRYPPSTEDAKFRTRERMLELRERIMNGTKFEVLARMYSEDPGSAIRGGEMDPMPKESFVQPFADALAKLKPGQISEVVETEFGYHLIPCCSTRWETSITAVISCLSRSSPIQKSKRLLRRSTASNKRFWPVN
ncbi:MAG: peptidylprolyl isomerase [Alistipes indistinctus]